VGHSSRQEGWEGGAGLMLPGCVKTMSEVGLEVGKDGFFDGGGSVSTHDVKEGCCLLLAGCHSTHVAQQLPSSRQHGMKRS
jgi:hypothetical protein